MDTEKLHFSKISTTYWTKIDIKLNQVTVSFDMDFREKKNVFLMFFNANFMVTGCSENGMRFSATNNRILSNLNLTVLEYICLW